MVSRRSDIGAHGDANAHAVSSSDVFNMDCFRLVVPFSDVLRRLRRKGIIAQQCLMDAKSRNNPSAVRCKNFVCGSRAETGVLDRAATAFRRVDDPFQSMRMSCDVKPVVVGDLDRSFYFVATELDRVRPFVFR